MSNFLNGNISSSRRYSRQVLIDWINESECTHAVTLVFNQQISLEKAAKDLGGLFFRFDKEILGKKAYKQASRKRSLFFAFPEHIESNLHFHLALRLPGIADLPKVWMKWDGISKLEKHWKNITKSRGNLVSQEISSNDWAHYLTKEIKLNAKLFHDIDFFLSTDFHNNDTIRLPE